MFATRKIKNLASLGLIITCSLASAETVSFHTGNGGGAQDTQFTQISTNGSYAPWSGLGTSDPIPTLTGADFTAVSSAQGAYILSGLAGGWIGSLAADPSAKWIGVDPNGWNNSYNSNSGLYATNFTLAHSASAAVMTVTFSVDDMFGDSNNLGMFVDGKGLAGSSSQTDWNNQVETKSFDLGPLSAGSHQVAFDVYNWGNGPSGMILTGTVRTSSVPSPAAFVPFAVGAVSALRRRKRA